MEQFPWRKKTFLALRLCQTCSPMKNNWFVQLHRWCAWGNSWHIQKIQRIANDLSRMACENSFKICGKLITKNYGTIMYLTACSPKNPQNREKTKKKSSNKRLLFLCCVIKVNRNFLCLCIVPGKKRSKFFFFLVFMLKFLWICKSSRVAENSFICDKCHSETCRKQAQKK